MRNINVGSLLLVVRNRQSLSVNEHAKTIPTSVGELNSCGKTAVITRERDENASSMRSSLRSSHRSVNDHRELFKATGYVTVQIVRRNQPGRICGIAPKPAKA
jgi:hypothetical protein